MLTIAIMAEQEDEPVLLNNGMVILFCTTPTLWR